MRKNLIAVVTTLVVLGTFSLPTQSFGVPVTSPGNSQGNGPCLTSGSTNSLFESTKNSLKTCTSYSIGDKGPGGGIVFYINNNGFTCGPTRASTCYYLEAAPSVGTSAWIDGSVSYPWSGNTSTLVGTSDAIGTGYENSVKITKQKNAGTNGAASAARAYRGPNNLSDWYLPSISELIQMCKWVLGESYISDSQPCDGTGNLNLGSGASGFVLDTYTSSTEQDANTSQELFLGGGPVGASGKQGARRVHPIRAF